MKKTAKIFVITVIFLIATIFSACAPPDKTNYSLSILAVNETLSESFHGSVPENVIVITRGEVPLEAETGDKIIFEARLDNDSCKKQKVSCNKGELLKIIIVRNGETVLEKYEELTSYAFPDVEGTRGVSEYFFTFSYMFEETGTYTVVATSKFTQKDIAYSYQDGSLTVIVK